MAIPHDEQAAFLAAIASDPDDDGPRLIFADWLEERGDPRGELIRVQCALARLPRSDSRWPELRVRQEELLREHEAAWTGHPPEGWTVRLERGLLAVEAQATTLVREPKWWDHHGEWVTWLRIRGCDDRSFQKATAAGLLSRVLALNLSGSSVTDNGLKHLAVLTRLRALDLQHTSVTDAGLPYLTGLEEIRTLYLWHTRVGSAGLRYVAELAQLRTLHFWHALVGDAELGRLARLGHLEKLDLAYTHVTDAGLHDLGRLVQLRVLDLSCNRVSDARLGELTSLSRLENLYLYGTQVTADGAAGLRRALPRCGIHASY